MLGIAAAFSEPQSFGLLVNLSTVAVTLGTMLFISWALKTPDDQFKSAQVLHAWPLRLSSRDVMYFFVPHMRMQLSGKFAVKILEKWLSTEKKTLRLTILGDKALDSLAPVLAIYSDYDSVGSLRPLHARYWSLSFVLSSISDASVRQIFTVLWHEERLVLW